MKGKRKLVVINKAKKQKKNKRKAKQKLTFNLPTLVCHYKTVWERKLKLVKITTISINLHKNLKSPW